MLEEGDELADLAAGELGLFEERVVVSHEWVLQILLLTEHLPMTLLLLQTHAKMINT